ncbi:MAG: homoserine O-succinyltransferase [Bacteroidales bacterium]
MPLILPDNLPAIDLLKEENIIIQNTAKAELESFRPLRVLILNLMPLKIETETDLVRLLSNSALEIEVRFLRIKEHESKNTPAEHLERFYHTFDEIREQQFDGMIITGAPVETLPFEEVSYWKPITAIFDWAKNNVRSTLYICWAAQAGLYHFFDVPKYPLQKKLFGIFKHTIHIDQLPIFRGFDNEFYVPHSRHTEVRTEDVAKVRELTVLSESREAGLYMAMAREGREFFISGHSEYGPFTLDREYQRDISKGLPIEIPENYYKDGDPAKGPVVRWRGHANLLFQNWLNYYVNPETPYNFGEIK